MIGIHCRSPCNDAAALPLALILALLAATPAAGAEESWWQRGKELLRGLGGTGEAAALTRGEIAGGLREALRVGSDRVIEHLGRPDGFNADPVAHIPLPEGLRRARSMLEKVGLEQPLDRLELRMNRAAEAATPRARDLFVDAIAAMTLEDVRAIYEGPEDAATQYFRGQMGEPLAREMAPIVRDTLAQAGAVQAWDEVVAEYRELPFVPDLKEDLTGHVVDAGIDAIFHYLAKEEAAIRHDPAKRTSALLRKVFGDGR